MPRKLLRKRQDEGFMLAAVIVLVFLALLALSVAAPRIAMQLKREREVEAQHRANQYVRAIRIYYKKFNHYPSTVAQLEASNNQKFLRQKYLDPLTGKDDWRLIHVGENKTKVKGFFGEDLPGIVGTGLGSGIGGTSTTATTGSTTNTTPGSASAFGGASSNLGGSSSNSSSVSGTSGSSGSAAGTTSGSGASTGTGIQSVNATDFTGGGGGPIIGIGSSKSGDAILTVNEQTSYQDWEFLYDPRIEQLYAKGTLLGGVNSGVGGSGLPAFGAAAGSASGSSNGSGSSGFGSSPGTGSGSGSGGFGSGPGSGSGAGSSAPSPHP